MVRKGQRTVASILGACLLCGGLVLFTPGCGPVSQQVSAPEPTNNVPPGGGNADEYAKKMAELKGGKPGGPGSPGSPPGHTPGSPPK